MAARVQYQQNAPQPRGGTVGQQGGYQPQPRGGSVGGGQRRTQSQNSTLDVKLYRIEQYQSMWNHFSGVRNARIQADYNELMKTPKGHQLQANLQRFWENKVKANKGNEVSLTRDDFFTWVGRYEMERPSRNAAGGYDSSDDEDGYDSGDYTDDEAAGGCCG